MSVFPLIKIAATALWGFSFWWLILAIILFHHYLKIRSHPLVFGWWAYTFPFEAFVVATGLLAQCVATQFLQGVLITLNMLAVIIWITVVFGTVKWLETGAFLNPKH